MKCIVHISIFQWYDHDTPESQPFPLKYQDSLQGFQRLMLLRCFRVDRIYRGITEYVTKCMSERYVTPPIISYEAIYEQSTPMSPIVFILSPGSDPASDLMKLAERIEFGSNKIKFLSMGQGQEKVCHTLLDDLYFCSSSEITFGVCLHFIIKLMKKVKNTDACFHIYKTCFRKQNS